MLKSLLILTAFVASASAAKTAEPASNSINSRCAEIKYTMALGQLIDTKTQAAESGIRKLQIYTDAWALAAESEPDIQTRSGFQILAAHTADIYEKMFLLQKNYEEQAKKTRDLIARREAHTRALTSARTIHAKAPEYVSGGSYATGQKGCKYKLTQTTATAGTCDTAAVQAGNPAGTAIAIETATHIKLLDLSKVPPILTELTANCQGTPASVDTAATNACGNSANDGTDGIKITVGAAIADTAATATEHGFYSGDSVEPTCKEPAGAENKDHTDNDKLAHTICNFFKQSPPEPTDPEKWDPKVMSQQPDLLDVYKGYLAGEGGLSAADAKQKPSDTLKSSLTGLLGGDASHFHTTFVKSLKSRELNYNPDGTGKAINLYTIAESGKTLNALIYLQGQNAKKKIQEEKSKEPTKITETDETCASKGTGEACKDGCKWEGTGENKKWVVDKTYMPKQAKGTKEDEKKEDKCANKAEDA